MNEEKQKTNLERVNDWIAQEEGLRGGVEIIEMESRCCPFHFWNNTIKVNPETSERTLRKHYRKNIVPFLRNIKCQKADEVFLKKAKERGLGDVVVVPANQHPDPVIRAVAPAVKEIVKEDYRR